MIRTRSIMMGLVLAGLLSAGSPARAGGLRFVESEFDSFPASGGTAVAVSPDGEIVYVVGERLAPLASWQRHPSDCGLELLDDIGVFEEIDDFREPHAIAVSPDGACLYVPSPRDDSVVIFTSTAGNLNLFGSVRDGQGGVDGLNGADDVVVSADGFVYVAGSIDDAVAVFARSGCGLSFVGVLEAGPGVDLETPQALALSPDGADLYVAGGDPGGTLTVLRRDAMTGLLSQIQAVAVGPAALSDVAASADGASVYVTSAGSSTITSFARNALPGTLTRIDEDHGGSLKIGGAAGLAVSPDGAFVYVAGRQDDALAVFARDATGALRFLESHQGLRSAADVAVRPDDAGTCVYTVGFESPLAEFALDTCGDGNLGVDEQCDDGNVVSGDQCSATCRLELCGPTPIVGCRGTTAAGRSLLAIKRSSDDAKDRLDWSWRGAATTLADFGDPTTGASYVLCVYDGSGGTQPLISPAAPADGTCNGKPCWRPRSTGFMYDDKLLTPEGVKQVRLRAGLVDGATQLALQGRGALLRSPAGPLTLPVTVQMASSETGVCWEAVYTGADRNDATQFRARSN